MQDNVVPFLIMAAVVAFIVGLAKGGLGSTLGALATPLMALVMPADKVLGSVLPILMIADVFAVALHWQKWDRRLIWLLLPTAVVGVTIGTWFVANAPTETLQRVLGVVVLLFTLYKLFEKRIVASIQYSARTWHGAVAGLFTGLASALAHNGGPPATIYLMMQNVTPQVFIATSALLFLILNWVKVPYYLYADVFDFLSIKRILWLMPLVPAGVWVGKWIGDRVNKTTFDWIITALLALTGLLLIF